MNFLLEPLQYPFMQQALILAIVIAVLCALLSCFLVLKGWALLGDAISHAVLPGIVLASLLNIPLAIGAFAAAVACTQASSFIERHSRLKQDAVLGIAFTSPFALGLLPYHPRHRKRQPLPSLGYCRRRLQRVCAQMAGFPALCV